MHCQSDLVNCKKYSIQWCRHSASNCRSKNIPSALNKTYVWYV